MSFPQSTPETTRWCALLIAIVAAAVTASEVFSAWNAENTGIAYYAPNIKYGPSERVTRKESPAKFHDAVLISEYHALMFGGVALIAFKFYRVLSD
jgi:hypothetical protein